MEIKVLVCGSYKGAFQVKLCQRLKKEKQEVFVLSNDPGTKKKTSAVFQDYRFPYDSESVINVMTSVSPDAVVFCGALDQAYDWQKGLAASVGYVAGIMNVMTCAAAVNVKRFLYVSSLDVFTKNAPKSPFTQREKAILQGEKICLSSAAGEPGPKISVVRMPQVYGICEKRTEASVCNEIAKAVLDGKQMEFPPHEICNLLYLDDAVDAVYKALVTAQKEEQKIYHIVPATAVRPENIWSFFESRVKGEVSPGIEETEEKVRSLSVTQEELGFSEKYTLEEGLAEFFDQYTRLPGKKEEKKPKKKHAAGQKKIFRPILETIAAFVLVQLFIAVTTGAAFHSVIDVYLIYVLIIAVVLGAIPSVIAVAFSVIGKYYMLFLTNGTLSVFTDYTNYLWILQIFSLAVLTGYLKDWYSGRVGEMKRENDYLKQEIDSLQAINDSNVKVKDIYEKRLVNYRDSYAKVYDMISELDELEEKAILFKAARVVSDVMESRDVAIYTHEPQKGYCRLMASTSELARKKGKSLQLNEYPAVVEALNKGKVYMNRKFEENMPMFAAAACSGEKPEAVIMVWSMELENVNLHLSNMLSMLSKLMERSITRALRYMDSVRNSAYIPGSAVLDAEAFARMLDIYCTGEAENVLVYTLLGITAFEGEKEALYDRLAHLIRDTDYLGADAQGGVYILLTNADEEEAAWVMQRCEVCGIKTRIIQKNKEYMA